MGITATDKQTHNTRLHNRKHEGETKFLLSVVFQHHGSFHDVLLMNRSDVDTAVLQCGRNKHCRRYDYNSYPRACTGYIYRG